MERQWGLLLSLQREKVPFARWEVGEFPQGEEGAEVICSAIRYLLRRDWVFWLATVEDDEPNEELEGAAGQGDLRR